MTRPLTDAQIAAPVSQLPPAAYFDESLLAREREILFARGPGYAGHQLMVPSVNDFAVLATRNNAQALTHTASGVNLISNICRHRQAMMLDGRGSLAQNGGNVVCPLHRWTYSGEGELIGAPHFPCNPALNLQNHGLKSWNGLLFDGPRDPVVDLATLSTQTRQALDFSGYAFNRSVVHECNYNWKTFVEVYLEDYHVGPFHPGLGQFVTCDDLAWEWGSDFSVQTVGLSRGFDKPGSPVYKRWHDQVMQFRQGVPPPHGAIWLTYYPNITVEWYPHTLVVSSLWPQSAGKTTNVVEFYYAEEVALFEPEFIAAQQAAYMETCVEDDEIAERMDAGRRALYAEGRVEVGPYQSPMEDGMQHFHEWYRAKLGNQLGGDVLGV
ncbi:MAG TPA: aromatic ring-hydroxylating dioxygenase subunit alpha [Burkholderiaceae bacterium]|mgnify:CR=1 FL=1|nr:aromatic ring-hydroxylating dioxygenase subunit alpha [Burkholderiaceae bacterium]